VNAARPKTTIASAARTTRKITTDLTLISDRKLRTENAVQLATGGSSEEQEPLALYDREEPGD
jgi:hypothetical protein